MNVRMEEGRCEGCNCGIDPKMQEILQNHEQSKDNLIQILSEVQDYYGYVPANSEFFAKLYPHGFLYHNQIEDIKKHIKQLKK